MIPDGAALVQKSNVIEKLIGLSTDTKAFGFLFSNMHRAAGYIEALQSLALVSEDISKKMYASLMSNFDVMRVRAWEVTSLYISNEKELDKIKSVYKANPNSMTEEKFELLKYLKK